MLGLTIGNWLQIGLILVGGTVAFTNVKDELAATRAEVLRIEQHGREMEVRIRAVEVAQAGQSSDLRNIQIGINEIKAAVNRLSQERSEP